MSLRKGATFNSPTTPPLEGVDPILNVPSLPKRSHTCPKTLEDVVAAGQNRMRELIGNFERNLSGLDSNSSDSQATLRGEDLPVPKGILDAHIAGPATPDLDYHRQVKEEIQQLTGLDHHHTSDSGIGTSISGTNLSYSESGDYIKQDQARSMRSFTNTRQRSTQGLSRLVTDRKSAITKSISSNADDPVTHQHFLGPSARKQIHQHIILPILREQRLKDFHPLVEGLPRWIGQKEITCLRDLEKTLIYLAPRYSVSKELYLNFCETSIQCIHTTVEYLNERDQTRPADRPYTNGYFLDLVEQIRQYAAMVAASRERDAAGQERRDQDYSPEEEVSLEGGLSQTGRPAELVRKRKGKAISLRTGAPYEKASLEAGPSPLKHALSEDSDDDVLRSMARRKKSAMAKDIPQKCPDCDKEFKRPCDLTKHEKFHSRPWKCSDATCKYHELGWPTEKERDRHFNDKHSKAPLLYKCLYHPCTYQSKRESNCKQHMEKSHGWDYIRSKNNGKATRRTSTEQAADTPITNTTTPQSGTMELPTPVSVAGPSPYEQPLPYPGAYSVSESASVAGDLDDYTSGSAVDASTAGMNVTYGGYQHPFEYNGLQPNLDTARPHEYTPALDFHRGSIGSAAMTDSPNLPNFGESLMPEHTEPTFDTIDWSNFNNDFTAFHVNVQLMTPAPSAENRPLPDFSRHSSVSIPDRMYPQVPTLSPNGHGNVMLYSPSTGNELAADEGFEDFAGDTGKPITDFPLFGTMNATSSVTSTGNEHMFPPLPTYPGQFAPAGWSAPAVDFSQQLQVDDIMQLDE